MSARRLKATISASGTRKNAASQPTGGRAIPQKVTRRSSIGRLTPSSGRGLDVYPHLGPGVALFGGEVGGEVGLGEDGGVVDRERLLQGFVGDPGHHLLVGVAVVEEVDEVVA